jgi:hypothetical protein
VTLLPFRIARKVDLSKLPSGSENVTLNAGVRSQLSNPLSIVIVGSWFDGFRVTIAFVDVPRLPFGMDALANTVLGPVASRTFEAL